MYVSERLVIVILLLVIASMSSAASDAVFIAYDADGTPHYSSQPYDSSYTLYLSGSTARVQARSAAANRPSERRRAQIAPAIAKAAAEHGVDAALINAVAEVESGFNPGAVSRKGARGLMQLMPATAAAYGVTDAHDVQQNLVAGTHYLKDLIALNQGNLSLALAAYNAGPASVARSRQRIPPFAETMLYVPRVLAKMTEYRRDSGGLP